MFLSGVFVAHGGKKEFLNLLNSNQENKKIRKNLNDEIHDFSATVTNDLLKEKINPTTVSMSIRQFYKKELAEYLLKKIYNIEENTINQKIINNQFFTINKKLINFLNNIKNNFVNSQNIQINNHLSQEQFFSIKNSQVFNIGKIFSFLSDNNTIFKKQTFLLDSFGKTFHSCMQKMIDAFNMHKVCDDEINKSKDIIYNLKKDLNKKNIEITKKEKEKEREKKIKIEKIKEDLLKKDEKYTKYQKKIDEQEEIIYNLKDKKYNIKKKISKKIDEEIKKLKNQIIENENKIEELNNLIKHQKEEKKKYKNKLQNTHDDQKKEKYKKKISSYGEKILNHKKIQEIIGENILILQREKKDIRQEKHHRENEIQNITKTLEDANELLKSLENKKESYKEKFFLKKKNDIKEEMREYDLMERENAAKELQEKISIFEEKILKDSQELNKYDEESQNLQEEQKKLYKQFHNEMTILYENIKGNNENIEEFCHRIENIENEDDIYNHEEKNINNLLNKIQIISNFIEQSYINPEDEGGEKFLEAANRQIQCGFQELKNQEFIKNLLINNEDFRENTIIDLMEEVLAPYFQNQEKKNDKQILDNIFTDINSANILIFINQIDFMKKIVENLVDVEKIYDTKDFKNLQNNFLDLSHIYQVGAIPFVISYGASFIDEKNIKNEISLAHIFLQEEEEIEKFCQQGPLMGGGDILTFFVKKCQKLQQMFHGILIALENKGIHPDDIQHAKEKTDSFMFHFSSENSEDIKKIHSSLSACIEAYYNKDYNAQFFMDKKIFYKDFKEGNYTF